MSSEEEVKRAFAPVTIVGQTNLLLAGPSRRPIDPGRALAVLAREATEAAIASATDLGAMAESLTQGLGEALGIE